MVEASVAKKFVDEAVVEKKLVVVPNRPMKLLRLRFALMVVEPVVSMAKIDVEAAFKTLKARPLIGVWKVVVAP